MWNYWSKNMHILIFEGYSQPSNYSLRIIAGRGFRDYPAHFLNISDCLRTLDFRNGCLGQRLMGEEEDRKGNERIEMRVPMYPTLLPLGQFYFYPLYMITSNALGEEFCCLTASMNTTDFVAGGTEAQRVQMLKPRVDHKSSP